jgi:hypothetical protein
MMRNARLCLLPLAAMAASPAQSATTCWDNDAVGAARIMEFQIAMMIATLRCTSLNMDIEADFKRFADANKSVLKEADTRLKKQFGGTSKASHIVYQNYQTRVSNQHSNRDSTIQSCTLFRDVAAELGKSETSAETFVSFASALVPEPWIDGVRCVQTAGTK